MNSNQERTTKLLAGAGLILTTIIWGGAFVGMKNAVDLIPQHFVVSCCLLSLCSTGFFCYFSGDPVTAKFLARCMLIFGTVILSEYKPKKSKEE